MNFVLFVRHSEELAFNERRVIGRPSEKLPCWSLALSRHGSPFGRSLVKIEITWYGCNYRLNKTRVSKKVMFQLAHGNNQLNRANHC